jgi:hypothetical protein
MDEIKQARLELKHNLIFHEHPGTLCACGKEGATDLAHIVYSRHPDTVELYDRLNMVLLHNACNTRGERLWINVNACLILLQRAGGVEKWIEWARSLPRKSRFHIPQKMNIAMDLWEQGVRPFEMDRVGYAVENL